MITAALTNEIATLTADPRVKVAALSPEDRAVQVMRELTKDAIIQRQADRMPKDHRELHRLEADEDFREVAVEVAKNHITEPEARRYKMSVGNVYDRALDYWQEADIDPQDKKGREVAKNKLSNLYAAANLVMNYRHTQIPEWLRQALNERDLSPRTAMVHPSDQARQQYLREHPKADPKNHTVAPHGDARRDQTKDIPRGMPPHRIHDGFAPPAIKGLFGDDLAKVPALTRDNQERVTKSRPFQDLVAQAAKLPDIRAAKDEAEKYLLGLRDRAQGIFDAGGGRDPELVRAQAQAHAVWMALGQAERTSAPAPKTGGDDPMGALAELAGFEEGKPADPTEQMSEEDAAEWEKQNAINRNNFKEASARSAKTLDHDRQRILDHLRQERWDVDTDSDPPFATTPDGVTRVWLEPRSTYVVHGRNPDDLVRDEAKSLGLGDLGKVSGPSFVYEVGEWVRDSTRDGGVTRDRMEPTIGKGASTQPPPVPAAIREFMGRPLPAVKNITDDQLLRDKTVREVVSEAVGMSPEKLHEAYSAAFDYNLEMSRLSMDLGSEDAGVLKRLRQVHALKMALSYARTYQKSTTGRPSWLRASPKRGADGVDLSLDPMEELRKMDTYDTTEPVDEMAALQEMARFEEGEHADPTEDMSPEDAAEWKKQHQINKDNFKGKAAGAEMQVDLTPLTQFAQGLSELSQHWKNKWREGVMRADDVLKKSPDKGDKALHQIVGRAIDALIETTNAAAKLERAVNSPAHRFASQQEAEPPAPAVAALAVDQAMMSELPPVVAGEDLSTDREAAAGLYGYPKRVEKASETASKRVSRAAQRLARAAYDRDPRVLAFLRARARKGCRAAGLLAHELKEAGALSSKSTPRRAGESGGLYGWGERASDLGLRACADLEREAGSIASDLLDKKDARRLAGFLREHASRAECPRAALLAYAMPEDEEDGEE